MSNVVPVSDDVAASVLALWRLQTDKEFTTKRQRQVYRMIRSKVEKGQPPPTLREMADKLGCNTNSVRNVINALKRRGLVSSEKSKSRTFQVFRGKVVDADLEV